ncbi:hypothetical protein BGZ94_009529, partial [Podila epigama]
MKFPTILLSLAVLAAFARADDTSVKVDDAALDSTIVEPVMADPIAFVSFGKGRYVPLTSSEIEAIETGDFEALGDVEIPQQQSPDMVATSLSEDEKRIILDTHNSL